MTTGRINQVTIVRRGWPTGAVFHAPERLSKLLVVALSRGRCTLGGPAGCWPGGTALRQIRFPPLRSPGHPSTRTLRPLWAVRSRRPRRRTQRAASAISASAARGCPLSLCVTAVASGQSPTEPIQRAVQRRCLRLPLRNSSTP
jgi:hypothetical protein